MIRKLTFFKNRIIKILFIALAFLLLGNIIAIYLGLNYPNDYLLTISLLDFDSEKNFPTYFSTLILLANACLLGFIGFCHKSSKEKYWAWFGLSAIFLFLSMDEFILFHEHLIIPFRSALNMSGVFYYAWIIPYGIGTILIGIIYLKFMMQLPKPVLKLFILAAVLFLFGAIGMEAFSGLYAYNHGTTSLAYGIMYTFEELLEMAGSITFINVLLLYISIQFKSLNIFFESE